MPPPASSKMCGGCPRSTGRRSSAIISASTSTCCSAARSAASRRRCISFIRKQPAAGDRGLALPAARRGQIRPADPRPRHPERHVAGSGGQIRAAVVRRDHAIERDRRPAHRFALYKRDSLRITRYRRLGASDPDLNLIHASWEQSLRRAVEQLPEIEFEKLPAGEAEPTRCRRAIARVSTGRSSVPARPFVTVPARCVHCKPARRWPHNPCADTVRSTVLRLRPLGGLRRDVRRQGAASPAHRNCTRNC